MTEQVDLPARRIVLVIEDEPVLRMQAVDVVRDAGFEVVEALDTEDAIRILETRPDVRVVFTDIDMPNGVDGMKLAATIRDRWPPIEFIITSSRRRLSSADMPARSVFVPMPYRPEQITEAMNRFLA